ncbi:hypothetical protein RDABS01_018947 [Bienertia sinuspersici]
MARLINSSDFVDLHLKISLKDPESHASLCFITSDSSIYVVHDLRTSPFLPTKLDLPRAFQHDDTLKLVGSCNGLLCVGSGRYLNRYFIFNPVNAGSFRIVPFAHNILSYSSYIPAHLSIVSGFGYDEKSDDYKIVYVWENPFCPYTFNGLIYSLKSGSSWKPLNNLPNGEVTDCFGVLNNCLHFVEKNNNVVFSFDLHTECWNEVHLPDIGKS